MRNAINASEQGQLKRYLSPLGAWALSLGCAVGWGAFMMPGNSFLPVAGPLGTVIGIAVGALIMLLIAANYQYLLHDCPSAGGAFSYITNSFDMDHGFVGAWFLLLTYIAIVWANATALPLIGRFLLGNVFKFGFHYRIAGFDVYFGELLLSIGALLVFGSLCLRREAAVRVQIIMAFVLCGGVLICSAAVFSKLEGGLQSLAPAFSPQSSPLSGIATIVAMSPWAFVGFESITHSAEEYRFSLKKALPVMALALVTGAAAYSLLAVIAATTLPEGFENWPAYIAALDTLDISQGAPVFYAVRTALGPVGTPVLVCTVLGGVITGLVGNTIAASRLLYAMAREGLMPAKLSCVVKNGAPHYAILLIVAVSVVIPFFGRTAVGWIVDVTTVGAAIVYAYVSACALKKAQWEKNSRMTAAGFIGLVISLVFLLYYLIPNLLAVTALSRASYLILALWSVLGLIIFRFLLLNDKTSHMGRSTIVWIVMLSLTLFTSLVWMRQITVDTAKETIEDIHKLYEQMLFNERIVLSEKSELVIESYLDSQMDKVSRALTNGSLIQVLFVSISVATLFNIYTIIHRREQQIEREKILAEESSRAKTSFLSNMSHEIRTPMNAIIGLDNIALKEPNLPPQTRDQLEKIGASAKHLLGLINDILDMSRIESGRMVLKEEEFSFRHFLEQINVMINGQCVDKGLSYECCIVGQVGNYYIGDDLKLKQVLINILGNAVKFTDKGGSVTLTVEQIQRFEGYCTLRFIMKDTGAGMSKEFIPKIFDAFSQENSGAANRYGSTGLGMAITKNLVEMMNGEIHVESEKGVGSVFTVTVTLKSSDRSVSLEDAGKLPANLRVLVVDDDEVALEHASLVLHDIGVEADLSHMAAGALSRIREQADKGSPYQFVLTDMRMPDMDGLALTRAIREFDKGATSVIILTGYDWDDIQEQAHAAGVDSIMSKPLFPETILREINALLLNKGVQAAAGTETQIKQAQETVPLEGLRVLMAEDIELNAEILTDLLDMEGVAAERAENGQIAVEMFTRHEENYYNAILMDVRMPIMDGLNATKAIRALPRADAQRVPIIAMTANAFDEDVQRSLQAGMNAHLSKPIEPDRLYDTLRRLAIKRAD